MLGSAELTGTTVIADLDAGIGTLTRLAAGAADVALIVVEPTPKSLEVGARAATVAREKGVGQLIVVANRVRGDADSERVRAAFGDVGSTDVVEVPDDPAIVEAEREGVAPLDVAADAPAVRVLASLAERLSPDSDLV